MTKNTANQSIGAQMIDVSTGAAFVGTVTVYITGDAGVQAIGSVGSGVCTSEGNGYFTYLPAQAETNYDLIAFTFIGSGAIPTTIQVAPISIAQATSIANISTPGSVTVNALLTAALQRLLSGGDTPSPDDLNTALLRFNDLVDAWKIEGLTVNTLSRVTWALTTAASYTVGSTGTIVIDRPSNAAGLTFALYDSSLVTPNELPMGNYTEAAYQALTTKTLTSVYPQGFYYNPTSPLGTLSPYPVPSGSNLRGVLYAPSPAGEVGLYDTLTLPQGYRRFYRDNLAVEMGPDFDLEPSPVLIQSAVDSKATVKRSNVRLVELSSDAAGIGVSGWNSGRSGFYGGG